jgi:hypothetical protein
MAVEWRVAIDDEVIAIERDRITYTTEYADLYEWLRVSDQVVDIAGQPGGDV